MSRPDSKGISSCQFDSSICRHSWLRASLMLAYPTQRLAVRTPLSDCHRSNSTHSPPTDLPVPRLPIAETLMHSPAVKCHCRGQLAVKLSWPHAWSWCNWASRRGSECKRSHGRSGSGAQTQPIENFRASRGRSFGSLRRLHDFNLPYLMYLFIEKKAN